MKAETRRRRNAAEAAASLMPMRRRPSAAGAGEQFPLFLLFAAVLPAVIGGLWMAGAQRTSDAVALLAVPGGLALVFLSLARPGWWDRLLERGLHVYAVIVRRR